MANRARTVVASEVRDVLNYFGNCPICGYPARACHITAEFDDGQVDSQTVAACGGWCGWKGPVAPTPMTGEEAVLTKSRNAVASSARGELDGFRRSADAQDAGEEALAGSGVGFGQDGLHVVVDRVFGEE